MNERETPSSNRRTRDHAAATPARPPRLFVTRGLIAVMVTVFLTQLLSNRIGVASWLVLDIERGLLGGQLWRLLTYPFAASDQVFASRGAYLLFTFELIIPLVILMTYGAQVERKVGWERSLLALLFFVVTTAVLGLPFLALCPGQGASLGGPIGLALALLSFHLFLFREEKLFGSLPVPFLFLIISSALITLIVIFALGFSALEETAPRNYFAILPASFVGALALTGDRFFRRAHQRHRDRREVALVLEEVNVRAEVEQLLDKIAATGMGSLTRREHQFLKQASRFYHTDPDDD